MSFWNIVEGLLLGPLKLVFEIIFMIANRFLEHPGLSIIVLSLIMNILVLPLYRRADAIQEQARDMDAKLRDGVAHIKKTFSGDERMMILQTYYRQNHYKPTDALKGSISLLLEIPFFMAAYQFLSNLEMLQGVSLGPIADLSVPDALIAIGEMRINLLPILMTLINVAASAIYLKGFPLKTKIQLYGIAALFLVLLYSSPAGLVFYWTLNNVFSLVKNLFYKLREPKKVLRILLSLAGVALLGFGIFGYESGYYLRRACMVVVGALLQLPMVLHLLRHKLPSGKQEKTAKANQSVFLVSAAFLTVLVGYMIPSVFLGASPQEFVNSAAFYHPIWFLVSAFCLAAGTFLVWMYIFYRLANEQGKRLMNCAAVALCGVMLVNYMFFGTDLGVISSALQYENGLTFSKTQLLLNLAVDAVIAAALVWVLLKKEKIVKMVLSVAAIALVCMSVVNTVTICTSVDTIYQQVLRNREEEPYFHLSKTGQNVVVIMLDRGLGEYVPYLMNEKPELQEQFDGFTYYSNTVSFGPFTNFGTPAVFGGYDYTPVEMNKRADEQLKDKHNEALLTMPVLFSQEGYDVTVLNPSYANYQWIPDLSLFNEYPEIRAYNTSGMFRSTEEAERVISNNRRNFFCFSLMKTMPVFLQPTIYNNGSYNQAGNTEVISMSSSQVIEDISYAEGMSSSFLNEYGTMDNLDVLTRITEDEQNTFLLMTNNMTHEPALLQAPDYVPEEVVDNREYDAQNADRFTVNGLTLQMEDTLQMSHYHTNMSAFLRLGEWFDYLRENGVYDNTRIILVSDHGRAVRHFDQLILDDGSDDYQDVEYYYPLLMVKDFDAEGFTTSTEFMTNADVATLATLNVIEDPANPFTGKPINMDEKTAHDQIVIVSNIFSVSENNGNQYLPARWASVKENIWQPENWTFYHQETVLTEHKLP